MVQPIDFPSLLRAIRVGHGVVQDVVVGDEELRQDRLAAVHEGPADEDEVDLRLLEPMSILTFFSNFWLKFGKL